jgi:hypothetical protein
MEYELAKQIKDAGFPQNGSNWNWVRSKMFPNWILAPYTDDGFADVEHIAAPTLEELIEASGDQLGVIDHFQCGTWGAYIPRDIGTNGLGSPQAHPPRSRSPPMARTSCNRRRYNLSVS